MRFVILLASCFLYTLPSIAQVSNLSTINNQDSIKAELKIKMPIFEGGQERLSTYLSTFLRYPVDAIKDSIQGKVLVEFMISTTGKVTHARVLESLYPSCDKEAVRVVSSMPDWIPGESKGMPVNVIMKIPIVFRFKH